MIDDGGREVFEESASPREVDVSPARTLSDGRLTERTELPREGNGKAEFLSREGPPPLPTLFPPSLPSLGYRVSYDTLLFSFSC